MRSIEEVRLVLSLAENGFNNCEIARRTGISRTTIRNWKNGGVPRAIQLAEAGASCKRCGHPEHDHSRLPGRDYAYLLGMYLGDGCISAAARRVFRLRIVLDRKYPGIVRECKEAMGNVMPTSRVLVQQHKRERADEVSSFSKAWPCLFPQHGPGKKHFRQIELVEWQDRIVADHPTKLLRGLIHSDGCRSINTIRHPEKTYRYPRYEFTNRSDDIKRIYCDACDRLGIRWRVMNQDTISVARRESIARLDQFIGPKR